MRIDKKPRLNSGFTLIELLVVIVIVSVLAAMSFAGVTAAMKRARTTEGNVAASALQNAVDRFYSEYNRLPDLTERFQTGSSGDGLKLLKILLAQEDEGSELENTRKVVFLEAREAKRGRGGLDYGTGTDGVIQGFYDPFGNPFTVILNVNYDEALEFSYGGQDYKLRNQNVAIFSPGADEEEGTSDDIRTFER